MENTDMQLLREAADEIKSLRRHNELMDARLNMFDSVMMLLKTQPNHGASYVKEDVVYTIEKRLTELSLIDPNK